MHEIPHVNWLSSTSSVILLQIVMVCPGTHPVRNHEPLYTTNDSPLKKKNKQTKSPKLKMLGPLCNQTVNLKTDTKTLYYSFPKLKYSPSIYLTQKKLD